MISWPVNMIILKEPGGCGVRPEGWGSRAETGECLGFFMKNHDELYAEYGGCKMLATWKYMCNDTWWWICLQRAWQDCSTSQDNKKMKRSLEEEQRARKDLEKVVRRVLKSMNDPTWDETNLWGNLWASSSSSEALKWERQSMFVWACLCGVCVWETHTLYMHNLRLVVWVNL